MIGWAPFTSIRVQCTLYSVQCILCIARSLINHIDPGTLLGIASIYPCFYAFIQIKFQTPHHTDNDYINNYIKIACALYSILYIFNLYLIYVVWLWVEEKEQQVSGVSCHVHVLHAPYSVFRIPNSICIIIKVGNTFIMMKHKSHSLDLLFIYWGSKVTSLVSKYPWLLKIVFSNVLFFMNMKTNTSDY